MRKDRQTKLPHGLPHGHRHTRRMIPQEFVLGRKRLNLRFQIGNALPERLDAHISHHAALWVRRAPRRTNLSPEGDQRSGHKTCSGRFTALEIAISARGCGRRNEARSETSETPKTFEMFGRKRYFDFLTAAKMSA